MRQIVKGLASSLNVFLILMTCDFFAVGPGIDFISKGYF